MTDKLKQDIADITEYYIARADMFVLLEQAILWFDEGGNEDSRMWHCLFEHQLLNDHTKELFHSFSYDTLSMFVGVFGAKLFIVGKADE